MAWPEAGAALASPSAETGRGGREWSVLAGVRHCPRTLGYRDTERDGQRLGRFANRETVARTKAPAQPVQAGPMIDVMTLLERSASLRRLPVHYRRAPAVNVVGPPTGARSRQTLD
jgi:hypothetical protein